MFSFIDSTFFLIQLLLFSKVKELAEKARAGKLKPNEFQGGTFRCFILYLICLCIIIMI